MRAGEGRPVRWTNGPSGPCALARHVSQRPSSEPNPDPSISSYLPSPSLLVSPTSASSPFRSCPSGSRTRWKLIFCAERDRHSPLLSFHLAQPLASLPSPSSSQQPSSLPPPGSKHNPRWLRTRATTTTCLRSSSSETQALENREFSTRSNLAFSHSRELEDGAAVEGTRSA